MAHTPGPWKFEDCGGFGSFEPDIIFYTNSDDGLHFRNEADKHLTCAAPDLLEACKWVLEFMGKNGYAEKQPENPWNKVHKAIAKAEGR